jgi:hypothetical protein
MHTHIREVGGGGGRERGRERDVVYRPTRMHTHIREREREGEERGGGEV